MTLPDWLPPMLTLDDTEEAMVAELYAVFQRDFKSGPLLFCGEEVWFDRNVPAGQRHEAGFLHIVTRENQRTRERELDLLRAERLPWCAAILRNATDPAVTLWVYREGNGRLRTYTWLEEGDYVVVLERKQKRIGQVAFMITAYHIDGASRQRSLRRRYEQREP